MTCSYPNVILCAAVCLGFNGRAETLSGRVNDPSGRGVAGAKVEVEPLRRAVFTGGEGEFAFRDLTPDEYSLSVSSREFEPERRPGVRVEAGAGARVEIALRTIRAIHMQVDIIGSEPDAALREIPGSAFLIGPGDLAEGRPADANEILRQAPGLHLREDSGPSAMRLNIGVRGLNPDRSRTLLVLEDGLPVALAPYGEPEMYYSPPIERMNRIEILKGSGSILHGPQTIGGVLNFITPDPPLRQEGSLDLSAGQYGLFAGRATWGGTREGTGWYLSALHKQGDGWRDLYFDFNDLMAKLNLSISPRQRLGLKLGFYDEKSNSTYLGLTDPMFRSDPGQNPVPGDLLRVRRYSGSVLHQFFPASRVLLSTSLFGYTTTRNWRRQDFDRSALAGVKYLSIAGDPSVPGGAVWLRDSSGNNNRAFDVAGVETRLSMEHESAGIRQRLETGARYLYEKHRDRRIDGQGYQALVGLTREDEARFGRGASGFVQNRFFLSSRLTITPGVRVESYDYIRQIFRQPVGGVPADVNIRRGDSVLKPIPGLGASFQASSGITLFAGAHRGFAPPRVKDAITRAGVSLQLDAELSWNYEAGARLALPRGLRGEATWFAADFQNQIVPAAVSGGATTTLANGGRTLHRGIESQFSADWDRLLGRKTGLTTGLCHTWLPAARFTAGANNGFRLPYSPKDLFALRAGWRHRSGFSLHLDGTRVGGQFADNRQTRAGSADGTVGLIPAYWVWNVAAGHEFRRERITVGPFFSVKNLGGARYIASRAPLGIQPGMFRQATGGLRFRF